MAATCAEELRVARAALGTTDLERVDREGISIPKLAQASAPRFEPTALRAALQQAFAQTRVLGGIDGVDCSEHPCIVFGRINGTEEEIERLEHAHSFEAYEDDVLTMLLWSTTDVPAKETAKAGGAGTRSPPGDHAEQSLFAFALYPEADKERLGENLDRRIRTRTSELWNSMNPADETGPSRARKVPG